MEATETMAPAMRWTSQMSLRGAEAYLEVTRKALAMRPERAQLWRSAIEANTLAVRHDAARALAEEAVARFPDEIGIRIALAEAMVAADDFEGGVEVLRADPRCREEPSGLSLELRMLIHLKRYDEFEAIRPLAEALIPDDPFLAEFRAYRYADEPAVVLEACDRVLELRPGHANARFLRSRALAGLGRIEEAHETLGLDRFVEVSMLELPAGTDEEAFHRMLRAEILGNDTIRLDPRGKSTRSGMQTGRFVRPGHVATPKLCDAIRAKVERYVDALGGEHGFERGRPTVARLHAWAVAYNDGGGQTPHRHPGAWLSGVFYVGGGGDCGGGGALLIGDAKGLGVELRRIEPLPGRVVLFPSSTTHSTEPAPPGAGRIAVAFDIIDES